MKEFQVNSTTYVMQIFMADSADGKTGKTGLTVTVELSKNGAAFAAAAGAVSEIGYGWYALAGHADDRDTLGKLALHASATGADAFDAEYDIVTHDPYTYGGNLDATISSRVAADDYVDHTAAIAAVQSTADDIETAVGALVAPDNATIGAIDAAVTALAGVVDGIDTRVPADPASDTTVLTRLATASYVAPDNATILSIDSELGYVKDVVDGLDARLPVDPVGDTTMNARFDAVDLKLVEIDERTQNLPDAPANEVSVAAVQSTADDIETAVAGIPTAVWAFGQRTNTTPAASVSSAEEDGKITRPRGDTWTIAITGLGSLTDNTKVWFTVKSSADDDDSESLLQIEKTAGLVYLNGAAGTSTDATLTVTDATAGNITIVVKPASTALLPLGTWYYDVQALFTTVVTTAGAGRFVVSSDITRATA